MNNMEICSIEVKECWTKARSGPFHISGKASSDLRVFSSEATASANVRPVFPVNLQVHSG